ncbi:MAG: helix-turn-helix transcriptional regulator [Flavobacteriales bacterium]|nr:helix-turn-helix transcriptional regulator [Flavobacteriales bacterium]
MEGREFIRVSADKGQIVNCRSRVKRVQNVIGNLSEVLNLAGSEVRLSVLYLLYMEEKLCVCDLSDILKMKIPAVSQHLRKMKDGGILGKNKVGSIVYYSLQPECEKLLKTFFHLISDEALSETKAA